MLHTVKITEAAEEIAERFNPKHKIPFPFYQLQKRYEDLKILTAKLKDNAAVVVMYKPQLDQFRVYVDERLSAQKQNYFVALGTAYYFLHKQLLMKKKVIVLGDQMLDMPLQQQKKQISDITESEARSFALTLLSPRQLVTRAWESLGDVEGCARLFHIPPTLMTLRLEQLGLFL